MSAPLSWSEENETLFFQWNASGTVAGMGRKWDSAKTKSPTQERETSIRKTSTACDHFFSLFLHPIPVMIRRAKTFPQECS